MTARKILMASFNHWTSPIQVGSHQLAREFVKLGYEVAFVSDPISPFHLLGSEGRILKQRWELYKTGGIRDLKDKLWAYVPAALFTPHSTPLLRNDYVNRNWWKFTFPSAVEKVRANGFGEVDLLYIESPFQSFWLETIRCRRSLYRLADHPEGYPKTAHFSAQGLIQSLARSVSMVGYTGFHLGNYAKKLGARRTLHIPNGVRFAHFARGPLRKPEEYSRIPSPRVVYTGSMGRWFDFGLVRDAALAYPKVSFVLIGSEVRAKKELGGIPNAHFLGYKSYEELPAYLSHCDLGIIPKNVWDYPYPVQYMNPLKLYEYMACGLPVVAVETLELRYLKSPAILAPTREAFIQAIREVLSRPRPARAFSSYARKHDWSKTARRILAKAGL